MKSFRLYTGIAILLGATAIRCHNDGQTQHYRYIAQAEWSPVSLNMMMITKDEYDVTTGGSSGCSSVEPASAPPPISYDLFLTDSAGVVRKQLTHNSGLPAGMKFKWSPAGDRIAGYGNLSFAIFIVDTNGVLRSTDSLGYTRDLDWSPDGSRLVCSAQARSSSGGEQHLYLVNPADGTSTLLLQDTSESGVVAWSSQNRIAYSFVSNGYYVLATINLDGTDKRDIDSAAYISLARWSPDGHTLLYARQDGTISDAFSLSTQSGARQTILNYNDSTIVLSLRYSPDGTHISSYTYRSPGELDLYVLTSDGATAQHIASLSSDASWSTDSKQVVYVYYNAVQKREIL